MAVCGAWGRERSSIINLGHYREHGQNHLITAIFWTNKRALIHDVCCVGFYNRHKFRREKLLHWDVRLRSISRASEVLLEAHIRNTDIARHILSAWVLQNL